ncbi:MAG: hypothetical protein LBK23_04020 [Oscillospiraceae bacterium]|nr:hypothetical protein [Oscillospiraceae bacterium]
MKKAFRFSLVLVLTLATVFTLGTAALAVEDSDIDYELETIESSMTGEYEYSTGSTNTWKDVWSDTLDISSLISSSNVIIKFRDKETDEITSFSIFSRKATPTTGIKYDSAQEKIIVPSEGTYEYKTGITAWTEFTDHELDTSKATAATTFSIRKAAVAETSFAATPINISVPLRAAAPTAPAYDFATDSVKGVTNKMQIALGEKGTTAAELLALETAKWKTLSGTTITRADLVVLLGAANENWTGESESFLYVRTAPTTTAPASHAKQVTLPAAENDKPEADDFPINYETELLTANDNTKAYEYSKDNKKTWVTFPATGLNITSMIPAANKDELKLNIRVKASAVTGPASDPVEVTIDPRPLTPTKAVIWFDAETEKFDTTAEDDALAFLLPGEDDYALLNGDVDYENTVKVGAASQSVKFRVPAVAEESFASATFAVTIPARPAAPSAPAYAAATDSITGVSTKLEWDTAEANRTYTDSLFEGATAARSVFTAEGYAGSEIKVYIRTAATPTVPASKEKTVTIPAKITAPEVDDDFVINYTDETLPDYTAAMEYAVTDEAGSVTSSTKWATLPTTKKITSLIPASGNAYIVVRLKAANGKPASEASVVIKIPARPATPSKDTVKFDGLTDTITNTKTLEYAIGSSTVFAAVPKTSGGDPTEADLAVIPGTSSQSFKFREKAVEKGEGGEPVGNFTSAALTVSVPARASAPSAAYAAASDTITGMTEKLQWTTATDPESKDATWNSVGESLKILTRAVVYNNTDETMKAGGEVHIRTTASATAPASKIKTVTFPPSTTAPTGITVDYATETLAGSTNTMEYTKSVGEDGVPLANASWTALTNNASITSLIPANDKAEVKIAVRYKATSKEPASPALTELVITDRPATPTAAGIKYDYEHEKFILPEGSVYSDITKLEYVIGTLSASNPYKAFTSEAEVAATSAVQSVKIRVAPVTEETAKPASLTLSVTIAKQQTAPATTVKWDGAKIAGLTVKMQVKIAEGEYVNVTTDNINTFTNATEEEVIALVRIAPTTAAPASTAKEIKMPGVEASGT